MTSTIRIDPRYHDAVIVAPEGLYEELEGRPAGIGTLEHRLDEAGIAQSVLTPLRDRSSYPTALLAAATQLGVRLDRCVVMARSESAVAAARAGGFGLIIGIRCAEHAELLRRCGADSVVGDLIAVPVRLGYQRISELADAVTSYREIGSLTSVRQPTVFLDFDGTLSDIVSEPVSATLHSGADDVIRALAGLCPVAIVSGRSLADIRTRVGVPGLWYAGNHGVELVSPDGEYRCNEAAAAAVDMLHGACEEIEQRLAGIDGVLVEDKRFAVAVHYRNVSVEHVPTVESAVRVIGQRARLRVTNGRKVVELRPNIDWDKGSALEWLAGQMPTAGELTLPVYVGDDLTDEDAFDAVRHRGVGVVVRHDEDGDRPTAARFAVDGPAAVCDLLAAMSDQMTAERNDTASPWSVQFVDYAPDDEKVRETLCTSGNGYVGVRGAAPESRSGPLHHPGTYAAGVYDRLTDHVAGVEIDNESLVNLPNWLPLSYRVDGGDWFDIDEADLLSYSASMDLRHATFLRSYRVRDQDGRITSVRERRLVAMHEPHVMGLQIEYLAENYSGRMEFRSWVDGSVANDGVGRYRDLASRHLGIEAATEVSEDTVLLTTATVQSRIRLAMAQRTSLRSDGEGGASVVRTPYRVPEGIGHELAVDVRTGTTLQVEKVVTLFTSRDHAISDPATDAVRELARAGAFHDVEHGHRMAWAHLWERFDIELGDDPEVLRVVRLHQLHLLQTLSPHTADLDVGAPARGLHGEAYRGHVFWDELFVFPVTNLRMPEVTKALLAYRYRRLPEARQAARTAGYVGAMFPWQSASDGREVSQQLHLNPRSGRWNTDASARAHHVGIAIAYNAWQYYQVTGDIGFLIDYGAEMLSDITRFFVSRAEFDESRERYVLRGVIGPDEFHSGYPGREYEGVDNNSYTNVMVVWVILRAMDALERLPPYYRLALLETLGIDEADLELWEDVSLRMFVPFHAGVISQFEGYENLEELDWQGYREKYDNLQRLDRILEAEGDDVNKYKAAKQADTLMLFYLLSSDELYELFGRLGYHFMPDQIPATVDYYQSRTSHGSTLSAVVHAWVQARGDRDQAMTYFRRALDSDLVDIQGGTTAEGIHLAAMAGSIDLLQRCFTGLEILRDRIIIGPSWPRELGPLSFTFRYRGHRLRLSVTGRAATLSAEPSDAPAVMVECRKKVLTLTAGGSVRFDG